MDDWITIKKENKDSFYSHDRDHSSKETLFKEKKSDAQASTKFLSRESSNTSLQKSLQMKKNISETYEKLTTVSKLTIYYSTILFLSRRYNECLRVICHGMSFADTSEKIYLANLRKLSGCTFFIKRE